MGQGRGDKPPTGSLYPRESYVCFFIFLVELAATWSLVALIYNNWIFYLPTGAEIEAEFELDPVMCTTTRNIVSNNCTWWSCMEWCLSATQPPDECIHLYANVRHNGSNIRLSGCKNAHLKRCDAVDLADPYGDFVHNCRNDFTCHTLTGLFRCENTYQPGVPDYQAKVGGACKNLTKMYECDIRARGEMVDCKDKAQCLEITGMFDCHNGKCWEMLDYDCERRCKDITCDSSVIVLNGDDILIGDCDTITHQGNNQTIWKEDQVHTLLTNCRTLQLDPDDASNETFIGSDCINGTLFEKVKLPRKVNFTRLLKIFASNESYENRLDKSPPNKEAHLRNIPFDVDITIYKETKLKINHEGCSNSLSEECSVFHRDFGKDGRNYTTKSRFPCFYTKKYDDLVAAFLDLEVSHAYFMFMLCVPLGIFLCSCFFCIFCSVIVVVDEQGFKLIETIGLDMKDAVHCSKCHMHLKGCYDWFRPPKTKYEIWKDQHEKKKRKLERKQREQDI